MPGRRDALVAAARLIQDVEQIALDFAPHAVATVGEVHVSNEAESAEPEHLEASANVLLHAAMALAGGAE